MSENLRHWSGLVVDRNFVLGEQLGSSDHSAVFLTELPGNPGKRAAIKLVPFHSENATTQLSRWEVASQLSHPNLLTVFASGRGRVDETDVLYVVMQFADENLGEILPARALTADEARGMLEPVVEALLKLHSSGLAHGKLRPGNILAIEDQIKLSVDSITPFGDQAIRREAPSVYDAPETVTGTISPASDSWSLGATIVEALTQHAPVWQPSDPGDPPLNATLPEPFGEIVRHCLTRDPAKRWSLAHIAAHLNPAAASALQPIGAVATNTSAMMAGTAAAAQNPPNASARTAPPAVIDPLAVPLSPVSPRGSSDAVREAPPVPLTPRSAPRMPTQTDLPAHYEAPPPRRSYFWWLVVAALVIAGALLAPKYFQSSKPGATTTTQAAPDTTGNEPSNTPSSSAPETAAPNSATTNPAASAPAVASHTAPTSAPPAATAPPTATTASNVPRAPMGKGSPITKVIPEVSQKARNSIEGHVHVVVRVEVDPDGKVMQAALANSSPSKYFSDLSINAAKQWTFSNGPGEWTLRFEYSSSDTQVVPTQVRP